MDAALVRDHEMAAIGQYSVGKQRPNAGRIERKRVRRVNGSGVEANRGDAESRRPEGRRIVGGKIGLAWERTTPIAARVRAWRDPPRAR